MRESRRVALAGALIFLSLACTAAGRAIDAAGGHATQVGIGAGTGALALLLLPGPGWAVAALAGAFGALGAILATPPVVVGGAAAAPPGTSIGRLVALALVGVVGLAVYHRRAVARAWRGAKGRDPKEVAKALGRALIGEDRQ